jgi:hypothetical protein
MGLEVTESRSRRQFSDILAQDDGSVDLAEGAPHRLRGVSNLDVPGYLARFEEMARELRSAWRKSRAPSAR